MNAVFPGRGIVMTNQSTWVGGHEVTASEVSVGFIDPDQIDTMNAKPGDVLVYGEDGRLNWQKPFDSDSELRRTYPALEEAWGTLMEAMEEYQLVKKLVQDHDKS